MVPIRLAGVFLTVGESREIRKLCCGIRDAGVERQYEAVGTAYLAIGSGSVCHERGQSGEVAATNLRGDALALGIVVLGVALRGDHQIRRGV